MGYRMHFYQLTSEDVKDLEQNEQTQFYNYSQQEVLCLEMVPSIAKIWDKMKPLFAKGTDAYNRYIEDAPVIVTKKRLREIVLAFYVEYQKYIILQSISVENANLIPKDSNELFCRCLHFPSSYTDIDDKVRKKDEMHSQFEGQYMLHQQFIEYCTSDGFNCNKDYTSQRFETLLDNPLRITRGNTMYDILIQLVYMYKTFSPTKKLILCGW